MGRPKGSGTKAETKPQRETQEIKEPVKAEQAAAEEKAVQYSEAQVHAMIAKAVAEAIAKVQQPQQIIQVTADTEKVHFLWQAEVADENVYEIGPNGMYARLVGKTGSFYVPKSDLSRAMDGMFRLFLQKRWIIAVDGLTEFEREAYGVNYKEGELLDKVAFAKLVDLGEKMLEIYPTLCAGHKEMVAQRYHEAFAAGNVNVTRHIVVELNRMSKEAGSKHGDFADIIEAMNEADKG